MIKANEASMTISGTPASLAAEGACVIKHLLLEFAKKDKNHAIAAYITFGKAMAEAGEILHTKYKIPLELLNGDFLEDEDEDEDDELDELLENLKNLIGDLPSDLRDWLLDTEDDEEGDD